MSNFRKSYAVSSIAFILLGIALLLWPGLSIRLVCGLFGLIILIKGIGSIVNYAKAEVRTMFSYFGWIFGAAAIALGVFLLVKPETVVSVLPILVGLFVMFDGIMRLQSAFELRNAGARNWWGFLLLALLSVVLGIVMLVNPFGTVEALVMAIGVILLVEGILNLVGTVYTNIALKGLRDTAAQAMDELGKIIDPPTEPKNSRNEKKQTIVDVDYHSVDEDR